MASVITEAAADTVSSVLSFAISRLIQLIDDRIHLDRNTELMQGKLRRMEVLLQDITTNRFQYYQRSAPGTLEEWSQRLHRSLDDARRVMDRAQQQNGCLDFLDCLLCRPTLSTQVREWTQNFDPLFTDLQRDISIIGNAQQIVALAPLRPEGLLQSVPQLGFVGEGIKSSQMRLQTWIDNEDHQFRIIGVYGMGGIGKTSLLKTIYNAYKKGKFESVIWTVVSDNYSISGLQSAIAREINLDLGSSSAVETRKMELSACLREKKFLLILDDLWEDLHLEEGLGIPMGNDKGSRVVISTRSTDVIRRMRAEDFSIEIQRLSRDEGWQLFCRGAFKDGTAPTKEIENEATLIAADCNGLPLAINVVAAAMRGNISLVDWQLALNQIKHVDPLFLASSRIDEGLYQRLRLSYDRLPHSNVRNCFLYCATLPEDWVWSVDDMVEMCIAEGEVNSRETSNSYLLELGRSFVKLLVERCLFQVIDDDDGWEQIKVHDVVHDMAIIIAEREENCFFRPRQNLQKFPLAVKEMHNCKRIAIGHNNISVLPIDFRCPNLLTLIMDYNESLREVPNGFLVNLTSLRVLDLSGTQIESLPTSLWHLRQLQYLGLGETLIKDLPEDICNLSQLQFLKLSFCRQLETLPCKIGQLENLRTLALN